MMGFKARKAQAAMEFLMTYGWAILVVLIVIGALAYFGVLSPSTLLPEKCALTAGIGCDDWQVLASSVRLVLSNGLGRDLTIWDPSVAVGDEESSAVIMSSALGTSAAPVEEECRVDIAAGGTTLRNGEKTTLTFNQVVPAGSSSCNFLSTGRDKNKYAVRLIYTLPGSTLTHNITGEMFVRGLT